MASPSPIDRVSALPDPIIHHIYSFFKHDEINKMMIVSTNLRNLCMTSPYLAFTAYLHHHSKSAYDFRRFLHELLSTKRNDPLVSLTLSWHSVEHGKLHCICGEVLPKDLYLRNLVTLVLNFFSVELLYTNCLGVWICSSCPALQTLVLHLDRCSNHQTLALEIPNLQTLEVSGHETSLFKWDFHLKVICKSLQHLKIKNFNFAYAICNITIIGPQLRTVRVDGAKFKTTSPHLFWIHAPKLRSFFWRGSALANYIYSVQSFTSLEEAKVELRGDRGKSFDMFLELMLHSVQHANRLEMHLPSFGVHGFFASLATLRRTSKTLTH